MAKIVIIGVGSAIIQVVKKLYNEIPEAKCISITMGQNMDIPSGEDNITNYGLIENSHTAESILALDMMLGSTNAELEWNMTKIINEQSDQVKKLFS